MSHFTLNAYLSKAPAYDSSVRLQFFCCESQVGMRLLFSERLNDQRGYIWNKRIKIEYGETHHINS